MKLQTKPFLLFIYLLITFTSFCFAKESPDVEEAPDLFVKNFKPFESIDSFYVDQILSSRQISFNDPSGLLILNGRSTHSVPTLLVYSTKTGKKLFDTDQNSSFLPECHKIILSLQGQILCLNHLNGIELYRISKNSNELTKFSVAIPDTEISSVDLAGKRFPAKEGGAYYFDAIFSRDENSIVFKNNQDTFSYTGKHKPLVPTNRSTLQLVGSIDSQSFFYVSMDRQLCKFFIEEAKETCVQNLKTQATDSIEMHNRHISIVSKNQITLCNLELSACSKAFHVSTDEDSKINHIFFSNYDPTLLVLVTDTSVHRYKIETNLSMHKLGEISLPQNASIPIYYSVGITTSGDVLLSGLMSNALWKPVLWKKNSTELFTLPDNVQNFYNRKTLMFSPKGNLAFILAKHQNGNGNRLLGSVSSPSSLFTQKINPSKN